MNLEKTSIFKQLEKMPAPRRANVLKDQGIEGLWAHVKGESKGPLRDSFQRQKLMNFQKRELAEKLSQALKEQHIDHAFIKGVTFLGTLYPHYGERFMSDIDLYIPQGKNLEEVKLVAKTLGFIHESSQKKWMGNEHKHELSQTEEAGGITLEIHTRLFWHKEDLELYPFVGEDLMSLGLEDHFVYLCGHYAYQHSCQKLYWLIDIALFYDYYKSELNWDRIHKLATHYDFKTSLAFIKKLLKIGFEIEIPIKWSTRIPVYSQAFFSDKQRTPYYLFLKYALKDRWAQSLSYSRAWLQHLRAK